MTKTKQCMQRSKQDIGYFFLET